MSDPVLKPCPFCNGPAALVSVERKGWHPTWTVGCGNEGDDCIATEMITTFSRKAEAAAAWNKRAVIAETVL